MAAIVPAPVFLNQVPNCRQHEQIFVGQFKKRLCQDRCLFMQGDIFIDNAVHFAFDQAKAAFHGYTAGAEVLLGDPYIELFRQIFQFLVDLFRFHGTTQSKKGVFSLED